jgi:resuscitation-promoting factor RpfB
LDVRPTRVRRLRIRQAIDAATLATGVLLVVSILMLASRKDVTLIVGGRAQAINTTSGSVQEFLETTGMPMSVGLQVEPPPATPLADGMTVTVSPPPGVPADALSMTVDPHGVGVWVVERTSQDPFGKAAPTLGEASASVDSAGQSSVVSVETVVSGKVHDVYSNAGTVGALLSAMGIQPDADDRVAPPPSTPLHDGVKVTYDRVDVVEHELSLTLQPPVRTTYSEQMLPGDMRILALGRPGFEHQVVRDTLLNGVLQTRVVVSRDLLFPPLAQQRVSGPMAATDGSLTEPGTGATAERGLATWYDPPWSGLTAAHPWLPFGTYVTVTDLETGRSVTVVIDDRGPFVAGKIIDLSPEAFLQLSPLGRGVLHVALDW